MPKFPEIPGYKFVKELGRGGMADVYLAIQQNLNRMVAIKILIPSIFRDSLFLKRFRREAQTLSKLVHPNIITVFDVGKTGDSYYIVMEYLQESLKERLKSYRKRKPEEALVIIKQISGALFYAHRIGFIHRDIKPDNIMFRKDGTPVVLDFGIARPINASTKLTKTGMSIGTPSYISPEQAKGEKIDGRSDIYSLGVVLYEMLTGKVPYSAENTLGVILKHIEDPIPRLPAHLQKYQHLIDRLMEKDCRKRIRSEEELNALLKPLLDARVVEELKRKPIRSKKKLDVSAKTKEMSSVIPKTGAKAASGPVPKPAEGPKGFKKNRIIKPLKIKSKKTIGRKPGKLPLFKIILLILIICFFAIIAIRFLHFNSDSWKMDTGAVKAMIEKNNFFDRIWNRYGRFDNQFEKTRVKNLTVVIDHATGLMWHRSGSSKELKHEMVDVWISSVNRQRYGGFNDWRLPTLEEAATLLAPAEREGSLYICNLFSPLQKSIWTRNRYGGNGAWVVRFDEGYLLGCPYDLENFVRPVRSIQ
jgi:serine/threonine protein kinase